MSKLRHFAAAAVAVALVSSLAVPALALAQEATAPLAPAPTATGPAVSLAAMPLQVQMWPEAEPNRTVMIVGSGLPTDTPLPATVRLPVPEGAEVIWAGEIGGGGPESDIQVTPALLDGPGGKVLQFTVSQFRVFQYEVYIAAPVTSGDRITSSLDWVQSEPFASLSVAWRIPAGTEDVELAPDSPGTPQTNTAGERLYTLATLTPAVGDSLSFSASYARVGVEGAGAGVDVLTIVLVLLVLAAIALVVVVATQRSRAHAPDQE